MQLVCFFLTTAYLFHLTTYSKTTGEPVASNVNITVADRFGRRCASSGSKWEPKMGYSRAVRSGNFIAVTGTVGINAD